MTTPERSIWLLKRMITRRALRELRTGECEYAMGDPEYARGECVAFLQHMGHPRLADVVARSGECKPMPTIAVRL
jgi:hypothetical protein